MQVNRGATETGSASEEVLTLGALAVERESTRAARRARPLHGEYPRGVSGFRHGAVAPGVVLSECHLAYAACYSRAACASSCGA